MPVTLTVSQIRDALYRGDGFPASPMQVSTNTTLGTWFHEGLSLLVDDQAHESPLTALADVDANLDVWKQTLETVVYERFVGPKLARNRAGLHESPQHVLQFWLAMREACNWIAELCWSMKPQKAVRRRQLDPPWVTLSSVIATNEQLVGEFREPDWTDSVRLVGVADAIIRLATTGAWCVLEFKTGQSSPSADLGQACLYQMIISALESMPAEQKVQQGSLAVISFTPQRQEVLFSADQLTEAKTRLLDLIGALAGVKTASDKPVPLETDDRTKRSTAKSASAFEPCGLQEETEFVEMGEQMVSIFRDFGVDVTLANEIITGPTFIRFPILLGRKTKVSSVTNRAAELQVRLGLPEEPFIARDKGKLVIDVQRPHRQAVYFDQVRDQLPALNSQTGSAKLPIGVDLSGELEFADLSQTDHCHMLVVGTTGSGKSEWLRLAIAGLIASNTPNTLRLLIIDPKRNAFYSLKDSPYLWKPLVFPDEQNVVEVFEELCQEMERRYQLMEGADSISDFAVKTGHAIPRIVCVCDEYRDLISKGTKERKAIEEQICRLGAKSRAAGIHLILATQEPSRQTIKGPLDSNIPAKVALKMQKHHESNMLLGEAGAEKLLGRGDLLFKDIGAPRRLQAPLLTEANRNEFFSRSRTRRPQAKS